jgi:hypothetical protein
MVVLVFLQLTIAKSATKLGIFFDISKEKAGKFLSGFFLFYARTL